MVLPYQVIQQRMARFFAQPEGQACFSAILRFSTLIWHTKLRVSCLASC